MSATRNKKDPSNPFDPANLPNTLTPIPHITGILDTSGTTDDVKVHEQIDLLLNYRAANAPAADAELDHLPDNAVTEDDAHGTGDNATSLEDMDKDTVGGTPLSDGYKDTNDQLENQSKTDVDSTGTPLGGPAANTEDAHPDGGTNLPYEFDEVYPSTGESDDKLDMTNNDAPEPAADTTSPVKAGSGITKP